MRSLLWRYTWLLLVVQLGGCAGMSKIGNDVGEWFDNLRQVMVGPSTETSSATRDQAVKKYGYSEAQGRRLEVDYASNTPPSVAPGSTLESSVTYTILAPENVKTVGLTETRTVIVEGDAIQLGQTRQWESLQGTHTSAVTLTIPKNMPKGEYKLIITISDGRITKTARTTFLVM